MRAAIAAIAAVAVAMTLGVGCKTSATTEKSDHKNVLSNAHETWCPDGFEAGANDTCFAIPEKTTKETPVLVYLHGMYQGHGLKEEWDAVRVAVHRGFATVIPRGKRGLCAWRAEVKDHYCWPQDPEDTHAMKTLIAEWERVLWQVDALLEPGTHKRYVLGSANGGMFASFLATRAIFPGQAYAVVNFGGGPVTPPTPKSKPVPLMLIAASGDDPDQKMKELHDSLTKSNWPHAFCPRAGTSALTNDDVEAALRFFKHDQEGSLKAPYTCEAAISRK
jgi:poly(3-hydroxybutyrate) depolymerase